MFGNLFASICLLLFVRLLCAGFVDAVHNLAASSAVRPYAIHKPTDSLSNDLAIGRSKVALLKSSPNRSNHFKSNLERRSSSKKDPPKNSAQNGLYRQIATTKYVIVVSSLIVPGSVYRIAVNLLEASRSVYVNASISRKSKGFEIGTEEIVVAPQSSELLLIKVWLSLFCFRKEFAGRINIANPSRFRRKSGQVIMS